MKIVPVDSSGLHHSNQGYRGAPDAVLPDAGLTPPLVSQWESEMLVNGAAWGEYLLTYQPPATGMDEQTGVYYDGQRVYYQIAEYTNATAPWLNYAARAGWVYLQYIESRNYDIQGYRRFPHGIRLHADETANPLYVTNVLRMRDEGAYSDALTSLFTAAWHSERRSREMAYMLNAHIESEKRGNARVQAAVALYVTIAMNHLNEWITGNYSDPQNRLAPFMVGLTCEALIAFWEFETASGRVPEAIFSNARVEIVPTRTILQAVTQVADHLRNSATVRSGVNAGKPMWVADVGGTQGAWDDTGGRNVATFRYEDVNAGAVTVDVNGLFLPLYAWLYKMTRDVRHVNTADRLFEACVALSNTAWNTKIFNQNYRWTFDYIKWRNEGLQNAGLL